MLRIKAKDEFRFWIKLSIIFFLLQIIVRTVLLIEQLPSFYEILDIYFDGFLWDIFLWSIVSLPFLLASYLVKPRFHSQFLNSKLEPVVVFIFTFTINVIGFCEIFFWNEFHSRFNFIAVDYLVYTNEVLANIKESFPVPLMVTGVLVFSILLTFLGSFIRFSTWENKRTLGPKLTLLIFGIFLPALFTLGIAPWLEFHEDNFHDDQLSRNGIIEFVRAYRSNRIDYQAFYPTLSPSKVQEIINSKKVANSRLDFSLHDKKPNVVIIAVESLGAKFIATLSGQKDTTPNLNQLSSNSIFFQNFYATGTRTVRGLEAINLSVPPTPGYAVVKRPEHKGLYSLGATFKKNDYHSVFLYGGNGFFDNMNSFFSNNGFEAMDLSDFKDDEMTFKNAWGVCDEDLFNKSIKIINNREDKNNPFLLFLLTTSNHRPFTYPENKIDIPSGTSRQGAVKYTDYAIGEYLKKAQTESWAKNTIFVIIADHSTEGRGQFDLNMADYHIPLWIYSPELLKPQVITKLSSQIDLLPSLIHLLGLKDESPFFGQSVFNKNWTEERAFIGNYQFVGYYKNKILTTLGPNRIIRNFSYDPVTENENKVEHSDYIEEAISYYQLASQMLDSGNYKIKVVENP